MEKEITGTLENWYVDIIFDKFIINGDIYKDNKNRWPDGTFIHTSSVISPSKEECKEGIAITTKHSTYLLGKKLSC